jgi:polar amino acid transport system permease protein
MLGPLLEGAWVTVQILIAASGLAIAISFVVGLMRVAPFFPVKALAVAYIEVFRGTSLLVQLFWWFFVLPQFGVTMEPMTVGIVGVGMNIAGYGGEVVRGAIQAVPKGQYEAATALNMSPAVRMRRVILPQACRQMLPPWGNLIIELLKGTSLVSVISIKDLTFMGNQLNVTTYQTIEIFGIVLILYYVMGRLIIAPAVHWLEKRVNRGVLRAES